MIKKGSPGFKTDKVTSFCTMRGMRYAYIEMVDVFVPTENKLTHGLNFEVSTGNVLNSSRLQIGWIATGIAIGAYEKCMNYCLERKQFGKPIAAF